MNYEAYKIAAEKHRYDEHPYVVFGGQTELKHFINYSVITTELKVHLAKVILCRNFSPAGGYCVLSDHNWFVEQFLQHFHADPIRPWITDTIKEAIQMILSDQIFTKQVIGTTYMFGVVEFYAKYLLGWRPMTGELYDNKANKNYREMSISDAINRLKKTNTPVGAILHEIDNQSVSRLKEVMIPAKPGVEPRIADRLRVARNPMLHGEFHNFTHIGKYLCMLYILFYLQEENILSQISAT